MDLHKIENVTIEEVKTAHIADESVQHKYGVKYHQFWVNQEAGTVFCLMEGPDKASCEAVHKEAHGNIACAMTEVEPGFLKSMMGEDHRTEQGHVSKDDGELDLGYRNVLSVTIQGITQAVSSKDVRELIHPSWARTLVTKKIIEYDGRIVDWEKDDSQIAVFTHSVQAVHCALQIQANLVPAEHKNPGVIFKIGISAGQPVSETGFFFNETITLAHRLSNIAKNNQILISSLVNCIYRDNHVFPENSFIHSMSLTEEKFASHLLEIAEENLSDRHFTLDKLSQDICVSRPQLYRKITALTGRSPHDFLHDLRMDKALFLLKRQKGNISEIAFEVGYRNPSWFSRCFVEKFGFAPSVYVRSTGYRN